jgi:anti-sigma B factor antagonist
MTDQHPLPRCRYVTDCAGARLYVYARSLATVLRVTGEIDASNAEHVTQEIRRFCVLQTPLILDLSHLDFLGVAGFRALLALNRERQEAGVHCSVVTGHATRLLTRIVKDHGLAIVDSVPEALQLINDAIRARRQFVSGLARARAPQRKTPCAGLT